MMEEVAKEFWGNVQYCCSELIDCAKDPKVQFYAFIYCGFMLLCSGAPAILIVAVWRSVTIAVVALIKLAGRLAASIARLVKKVRFR